MSKKLIFAIVVIVAVLVVGYLLMQKNAPAATQSTASTTQTLPEQSSQVAPAATVSAGATYEVIYNDAGYAPAELTIAKGDTVVFKNQSSQGMWTASGMHPSHVVYSGTSLQEHCPDPLNTSFDECKSAQPGESWSFTFEKTGTWGYHNHVNARKFGKITVQ